MVITGGYNVYRREVDEVLYAHADVLRAAAVGVTDDYRGEKIKAYVALKRGAKATVDDSRAHCAANLAKYKVPAEIEIVAEVAKTTVGKIDKKALRSTGARAGQ
ncbi:MAG TPA: hypothetical protein VMY41_01010 [Thermohalobaculum sp.]|nr:hypothetical protein [Thermohalobaculum sp.]